MRVKLLIATGDIDYAGHLSDVICANHSDLIEVSVCQTEDSFRELLAYQRFDAAALDSAWAEEADTSRICLPLLFWVQGDGLTAAAPARYGRLRKYQRVSRIVESIVEQYAKVASDRPAADHDKARVTAVWSPAGGTGKTTVALAYAAGQAASARQTLYLNLEYFSSVPAYFPDTSRSISAVFEMLETCEGDAETLLRGIQRRDEDTGIIYFGRPDNFDDMTILSAENVAQLISACAGAADELIVDMSCGCDDRAKRVFELADRVLIVTDPGSAAQAKLSQFTAQSDVYPSIAGKATLVANKGAAAYGAMAGNSVRLPIIQSPHASEVYKALAGSNFES